MKISTLNIIVYKNPLSNGELRSGALINIIDEKKNSGWGDIAPLPKWSKETLENSLEQLELNKNKIVKIDWTTHNFFEKLSSLELLPSVTFGLETALLSTFSPLSVYSVAASALLMGTKEEILEQAKYRYREGFRSAKLKVSNHSFKESAEIINLLKDMFYLRIDVNRAWSTSDSLKFFEQFPLDNFDYVEEPFQNPNDLLQFIHPLAVDESFPKELSLKQLELLPSLKAIIYKPTIQGGMLGCLPLHKWALENNIQLVLSSSYESDVGLISIASIAHRLSLTAPIGIGTYHYLNNYIWPKALKFASSFAKIEKIFDQ